VKFAEAGVWARAHPAKVVVDLGEANRENAKSSHAFDQGVTCSLGFEVVASLGDWKFGLFSKKADYFLRETLRGVDTGSDCGSAKRNFRDSTDG
jgi:hypothetical protein